MLPDITANGSCGSRSYIIVFALFDRNRMQPLGMTYPLLKVILVFAGGDPVPLDAILLRVYVGILSTFANQRYTISPMIDVSKAISDSFPSFPGTSLFIVLLLTASSSPVRGDSYRNTNSRIFSQGGSANYSGGFFNFNQNRVSFQTHR